MQIFLISLQYVKENFPNLLIMALLVLAPDCILTVVLNSARKKETRLEEICRYIK